MATVFFGGGHFFDFWPAPEAACQLGGSAQRMQPLTKAPE
jgi:hypothetical protein